MPWTCAICAMAALASFSKVARSGPMILAELAPLTPDSPSSTLSWMYCEKLKSMPTNFLLNSSCSSLISLSLVKPTGHSSNGFSGTKNSAL